jgi:SAM-dependent methyltransferase
MSDSKDDRVAKALRRRADLTTAGLNLAGTGIEYGPLERPSVLKAQFPNVRYVDHADRDRLIKHYSRNPKFNPDTVPEIDIVTEGAPITHFVRPGTLDYVVALGVLEHVPDFIGWLEANLTILKPGGGIGIGYPDRRYCFDIRRHSSLFSDLVASWLEKRTKPSFRDLCDHYFNVSNVNPAHVWSGECTAENAELIRDHDTALKLMQAWLMRDDYIDCHVWKFSDEECLKVLHQIRDIIGLPFEVKRFVHTARNTSLFYFTLVKSG